METRIKYPIGIQTFEKIIEGNYLYIDKTKLIYDLANNYTYVFLSRPRRFGKSLLMSTLEAYFKGRKGLFKGLAIDSLEKDWKEYPVFRFDLSGENYSHPDRVKVRVNRCLKNIEKDYGLHSDGDTITDRFANLISLAHEKYGRKVVILIDEYDKPMLDCLHDDPLHEEIKAELRGFYSAIKLNDEHIHFAMLTGVTKFGKVSIFSGLNNLKDISMLPKYNALCGISSSEFQSDFGKSVEQFSEANGITPEETWEEFKLWYDGYHFAIPGEFIYNPFSVLNAFDSERINAYWFASGSSSYLVKLVKKNQFILSRLEGEHRTDVELSDITDMDSDFVPLLYQSGYLTLKDYDRRFFQYTLGFPNREVYEGFWKSLARNFFRGYGNTSSFSLREFSEDVNSGKPEQFMSRLSALFADTEPGHESNKEIHFQNMMAIACKMLGLVAKTEIHSSRGRCDMQIETPAFVYIFEFKINGSAEEALQQIKDKDYAGRFGMDPRTVFLIGANFSTETRNLTRPYFIEML